MNYPARPITWQWLAGFTDGDGCISMEVSKGRYRYSRIRWSQKESTSWVLDEILELLQKYDVKVTDRNFSVAIKGHKYPQRELCITNAADTRFVLRKLLPYLVVKRERAIEALEILDEVHRLKKKYGWKYRVRMA